MPYCDISYSLSRRWQLCKCGKLTILAVKYITVTITIDIYNNLLSHFECRLNCENSQIFPCHSTLNGLRTIRLAVSFEKHNEPKPHTHLHREHFYIFNPFASGMQQRRKAVIVVGAVIFAGGFIFANFPTFPSTWNFPFWLRISLLLLIPYYLELVWLFFSSY